MLIETAGAAPEGPEEADDELEEDAAVAAVAAGALTRAVLGGDSFVADVGRAVMGYGREVDAGIEEEESAEVGREEEEEAARKSGVGVVFLVV